ncbi:hypothetical protein GCM10011297_09220 [Bacterioplanes sanyensis]|uniref:hypothetical protein n=1 Tax=Bacterioplanes sanyensis TaxID=1249553 RepID=UPI001675D6A9|nr:hypothetical protein [Bacterioplanes sanyensis]GGY38223.1 hypothetical protein GCM10011297_09220 [Bacterioplanes sanyensis]
MYLNDYAQQRGAGLPLAIFIVTALALIITAMSQLQSSSSASVALQLNSQRAFYAAESGAQLAMNVLFPPDGSAGLACATTPFYSQNFTATGLAGCQASVQCTAVTAGADSVFTLRSTGSCGNGASQARRVIEVRAQ